MNFMLNARFGKSEKKPIMKTTTTEARREKTSDLSSVQVFTPRWAVDEMLDLIDDRFKQQDTCFFDPTCGQGHIIIPVLDRLAKYHGANYAIQNVFGIDIDEKVLNVCRGRVHVWCLENKVNVELFREIDLNFRVQDFFDCFSSK